MSTENIDNAVTLYRVTENIRKKYPAVKYVDSIDEITELFAMLLTQDIKQALSDNVEQVAFMGIWNLKIRKGNRIPPSTAMNSLTKTINKYAEDNNGELIDSAVTSFRDLLMKPPRYIEMVERIQKIVLTNSDFSSELEVQRNVFALCSALFEEIAEIIYVQRKAVKLSELGVVEASTASYRKATDNSIGMPRLTLEDSFHDLTLEDNFDDFPLD